LLLHACQHTTLPELALPSGLLLALSLELLSALSVLQWGLW